MNSIKSSISMANTAVEKTSSTKERQEAIDMLKALMTILVVFHHAAITYGAIGGWYYHEVQPSPALQSRLLVFFCTINQTYFMGLFFLIAGYFTPAGIQRKGIYGFMRDRIIRLGIPLLVFSFLLGPITIAIAKSVKGAEFVTTMVSLLHSGSMYRGPLWFAQALLLMSFGVVLWHSATRVFAVNRRPDIPREFPPVRTLLLVASGTGLAAFGIRLYWPVGREFWGMQLGYFASYIVLFFIGYRAANGSRLEGIPDAIIKRLKMVAWITFPTILPLAFLAKRFAVFSGDPTGGWSIPALMYAMWEPFIALGIIAGLLRYTQRRFSTLTPVFRNLSRRAYGIYIIHPVILVAISVNMRSIELPPLLKFVVVGGISCYLCYLLAGALLRSSTLRRIV